MPPGHSILASKVPATSQSNGPQRTDVTSKQLLPLKGPTILWAELLINNPWALLAQLELELPAPQIPHRILGGPPLEEL